MTATTPANLPALVRRQWDREPDAMHPLVWAEWLEEHGQTDRGELVRLLHEGRHTLDCDCTRCRRSRELRMRLSAWKCPECWGKGIVRLADFPPVNYRSVREAMVATPSFTIREEDCARCRGTGDSLTDRNGDAWFQYPLTWDCGFPRWVTLPAIDDAVGRREVQMPCRACMLSGFNPRDCENCEGSGLTERMEWLPTPRLRALAAVPPWDVPLDGVRVRDRGPYKIAGSAMPTRPWAWDFNSRDGSLAPHCLPRFRLPYFDDGKPEGFDNGLRYYPTGQAAADALARGLVRFAREGKG
jgi:uncharacterized protein (TIGR02996 family)